MAESKKSDTYANLAIIACTESGANTLTFKKLETGVGITEKTAWVIHRAEYFPTLPQAAVYNGDGDSVRYGLTVSKGWTVPSLEEETILDMNCMSRIDFGTAADAKIYDRPKVKDFSSLPGGGILMAPNPFYLFVVGSGLVSATEVVVRLYYTTITMTVEEYWQLLETRRVLEN